MHGEQLTALADFITRYLRANPDRPVTVADIGSMDVNGCARDLFPAPYCEYIGLDIEHGKNVDRLITADDFGPQQFDVVVSGSCLEHVPDLAQWVRSCVAIMKPGGLLCVTVPHGMSGIPEHRYPVDCWRIWPDGMRFLFRELEILECRAAKRDTVMIARKPQ